MIDLAIALEHALALHSVSEIGVEVSPPNVAIAVLPSCSPDTVHHRWTLVVHVRSPSTTELDQVPHRRCPSTPHHHLHREASEPSRSAQVLVEARDSHCESDSSTTHLLSASASAPLADERLPKDQTPPLR